MDRPTKITFGEMRDIAWPTGPNGRWWIRKLEAA